MSDIIVKVKAARLALLNPQLGPGSHLSALLILRQNGQGLKTIVEVLTASDDTYTSSIRVKAVEVLDLLPVTPPLTLALMALLSDRERMVRLIARSILYKQVKTNRVNLTKEVFTPFIYARMNQIFSPHTQGGKKGWLGYRQDVLKYTSLFPLRQLSVLQLLQEEGIWETVGKLVGSKNWLTLYYGGKLKEIFIPRQNLLPCWNNDCARVETVEEIEYV